MRLNFFIIPPPRFRWGFGLDGLFDPRFVFGRAGVVREELAFWPPRSDALGFDLPAFDRAIATACFWGFPLFISAFMFWEITFWLEPLFNGIADLHLRLADSFDNLSTDGRHHYPIPFILAFKSAISF